MTDKSYTLFQDKNAAVDDIEYEWDEVSDEDRELLQHAHDWILED